MPSCFAPGRVRLLGDHLEPLGLGVITAAIDMGVQVEGGLNEQTRAFHCALPDLDDDDSFVPGPDLPLRHQSDWLRASVRLLCRQGWSLPHGGEAVMHGTLPAHVGLGSGSAACVAWLRFLLLSGEDPRAQDDSAVARLAWEALGAPAAARVAPYSCALGGTLLFECGPELGHRRLPHCPDTFVLGVAMAEPSDGGLSAWPASPQTREQLAQFASGASLSEARSAALHLDKDSGRALVGTILARDLVAEGRAIFDERNWSELGPLLSRQHSVLRDRMGLSTPKLEAMLEGALRAGARGGKLLESHSIILHAPRNVDRVMHAIEVVGGRAWVVRIAESLTTGHPTRGLST
jgi:galactokinase